MVFDAVAAASVRFPRDGSRASLDEKQLAAELKRPGWPKMKACLLCGRPRLAASPSDRLHDECRAHNAALTDAEHIAPPSS